MGLDRVLLYRKLTDRISYLMQARYCNPRSIKMRILLAVIFVRTSPEFIRFSC